MQDWGLYKSNTVIENHKEFVDLCHMVHKKFRHFNEGKDSTWYYNYYNFFSAADYSRLSYGLLKDIKASLKDYVKDDRPLFIRSWLNYHQEDKVLGWHKHAAKIHGYVSIDPKETMTLFRDDPESDKDEYEIINEVGKIYIGPGKRYHAVFVGKSYIQPRITIAFDIVDEFDENLSGSWSFFPLL